jgi:hypothetical protein
MTLRTMVVIASRSFIKIFNEMTGELVAKSQNLLYQMDKNFSEQ